MTESTFGLIKSKRLPELSGEQSNWSASDSHFGVVFSLVLCYHSRVVIDLIGKGAPLMEWTTPQHEEICLNCEVSSYANAEL
jgi:hypothetical protein